MYENVLYICDISNFSNLNKDYRHLFLKNLYMMLTIVYWIFTFLLLYVHFSSVKILPRYCSDFYTGFFFSFLLTPLKIFPLLNYLHREYVPSTSNWHLDWYIYQLENCSMNSNIAIFTKCTRIVCSGLNECMQYNAE